MGVQRWVGLSVVLWPTLASAAPRVDLQSWGRDGAQVPLTPGSRVEGPCETLDHGDVSSFTCGVPGGVEHIWELRRRPLGAGPLVLTLSVAGALPEQRGEGALLREGAQAWSYDGLVAWDATHRILPSEMVVRDGAIALVVDDRDAVWPVTVDPVLKDVVIDSVAGTEAFEYMGWFISPIGDLNGDGFDDFEAASINGNSYFGTASVWYGGPGGFSDVADQSFASTGWGQKVGMVASSGDLNGDGFDDLVLGHAGSGDYDEARAVFVHYGSAAGVTALADEELFVADGVAHSPTVFAELDLNGDFYDDVITGDPATTNGTVRIWFGGELGVSLTPDLTFSGVVAGDKFGSSVTAGDLDGDGHPELIVGASGAGGAGAVYVFPGSATGPTAAPITLLSGDQAGAALGATVVSNFDIDDDGLPDLMVGEPLRTVDDPMGDPMLNAGRTTVLYGTDLGGYAVVGVTVDGLLAECYQGIGNARAGDLGADGFGDVIITGDARSTCDRFLYEGGPSGLRDDWTASWTRNEAAFMAGVGDIDQDGFGDLAQAAPVAGTDTIEGAGRVFFFSGAPFDADGDGFEGPLGDGSDCDDDNEDINPDAQEICDDLNVDEDCDELSDDADASVDPGTFGVWFIDEDLDGFGDETDEPVVSCEAPEGRLASNNDCNDNNANIHPGAPEICDPGDVDEDCDGIVDDLDVNLDLASRLSWYTDTDQDGFGGEGATATLSCAQPTGSVLSNSDCDDNNASISPSAQEVCDDLNVDEDCDDLSDDADLSVDNSTLDTWFADDDTDGFGDVNVSVVACDVPAGHVADATDCDDSAATVHPGAQEICDALNVDEDCDELADDADTSVDPATRTDWFVDGDSDGFGAGTATSSCDAGGKVDNDDDCDDVDAEINPDATEVCDGFDQDEDCDGLVDDADDSVDPATRTDWFADADADGFGAGAAIAACDAGTNADNDDDCDDEEALTFPGATETEDDEIDQDCDGKDAVSDDPDYEKKPRSCGCAQTGAPLPMGALLAMIGGLLIRRRR